MLAIDGSWPPRRLQCCKFTKWYPDGTLRLAWLAEDEIIDGIPCSKFTWITAVFGGGGGTYFHANGR